MKKFRTILAALLLLFITTPVLQSCLDDWDDDEHPLLLSLIHILKKLPVHVEVVCTFGEVTVHHGNQILYAFLGSGTQ